MIARSAAHVRIEVRSVLRITLLHLAHCRVKRERSPADKQQRAANDSRVVRQLSNVGFSDDDCGFWFDVKRPVGNHATSGCEHDAYDEEERFHFTRAVGMPARSQVLLTLERRLSLLEKRADAFVFIFRREAQRKQINLAP